MSGGSKCVFLKYQRNDVGKIGVFNSFVKSLVESMIFSTEKKKYSSETNWENVGKGIQRTSLVHIPCQCGARRHALRRRIVGFNYFRRKN